MEAWNKGKCVGQKKALIWRHLHNRIQLELEENLLQSLYVVASGLSLVTKQPTGRNISKRSLH